MGGLEREVGGILMVFFVLKKLVSGGFSGVELSHHGHANLHAIEHAAPSALLHGHDWCSEQIALSQGWQDEFLRPTVSVMSKGL